MTRRSTASGAGDCNAARRERLLQGLDLRRQGLDVDGVETSVLDTRWPLHVVDGVAEAPHIEQTESFEVALRGAIQEATTTDRSTS